MFNNILYVEIDVFAALVLLVILDHGKRALLTETQKLFQAELLITMLVLLSDGATWALDGAVFPGARGLNLAVNFLYWFATLFPCYVGLLYCLSVAYGKLRPAWCLYLALPILAGAVLLLANFRNGWIFTVDAANIYARGPYFLAVGMLPFVHMAVSAFVTLRKYRLAAPYERKRYLMLTLFMLAPLAGALVQIFVYGIVTIWICLTLSMLMCYVYIQNGNLATDPLTGLNNRGRFDAYSAWLWENLRGSATLRLFILDIDRFKSINDTFGHMEGDTALVSAAEVLKTAMSSRSGFLARIGGDEFAILLSNADERDCAALTAEIRRLTEERNRADGKGYSLSFSMGSAGTRGDAREDFRLLFARADNEMYREKSRPSGE